MTEPVAANVTRCLCGHDSLDHYGLAGAGGCDHRACGCMWFRLDTRSAR